jgi:DNA-binding response OmpR family regulator
VAGDDLPIPSLVTKVLRREDCTVDTAQNGREALTLLSERDYALIVLDLATPEVNGAQLRKYPRHRDARPLRRTVSRLRPCCTSSNIRFVLPAATCYAIGRDGFK